ncbi:hypothetical protein E4U30_003538 [Claviceps sp. LM220 group G6]|nr:hypothetical protein E4U30_003538 [Claviceps sp. LM220 group G6]
MSIHSILHSLLPSHVLNHSSPNPVHSALLAAISSAAAPASAFAISTTVALNKAAASTSSALLVAAPAVSTFGGRGRNQLLRTSKKHLSDQLHDVKKSMRSRIEQYTQGRLRK